MDRKESLAGSAIPGFAVTWRFFVPLVVGLLGLLAFLPGCNSQSSSTHRALQQIRPANNTALLVRNAAYLKKTGRVELAMKDLEEAHAQEPENLEILDTLIQSYEELGDFDRAQELYEEALSRGGHHPALENNRCYSLYLQGRLGQAEACFRKVLARQPDNQTARNNLGLVLCQQGREAEAMTLWREALSEGEARQRLGQALATLGKEVPPSLAGPVPAPAGPVAAAAPTAAASVSASLKNPEAVTSPAAPNPPLPEQPLASSATPMPPASPSPTPAVPAATAARAETAPPAAATHASPPINAAPKPKPASPPILSVLDLTGTWIEVKNGNGIQDDAREARSLLSLEGFTVVGIGNHIDFGLEETVITYRPESAKVAKMLAAKYFPGAKLQKDGRLSREADIRVSLGRDRLAPQNIARATEDKKPAPKSASASPSQSPGTTASEKGAEDKAPRQAFAPPATPPDFLTAQELSQVRIELRNGNGLPDQAREMRGYLALEGFTVAAIGNHKDFGLEKTIIAYRPEGARVARILYKRYFPEAVLQEEAMLPPWTDVRVSLGRDLVSGLRHMAGTFPGAALH